MIRKIFIYIILISTTVLVAKAEKPQTEDVQYQTWIDSAAQAYKNQQFDKASKFYAQVISHGMASSDLYYNLANAWYKQGMIARAILYYEKALKYNPAHEDARFNLLMANSLITDRIEPAHVPFYKRWFKSMWQSMSLNSWAATSIILFILLLASVLIFVFSRSIFIKKLIVPLGFLALVLMILSLTLGGEARSYMEDTHKAIIFEPTLNVKSTPDNSGTNLFTIHEGLKVEIRQHIGEWSEIEIADGRVGWVPSETYVKI
jgi:tetratricopeptide (TPR) repeat protein